MTRDELRQKANDLPAENAIDAFKTANWKTGDEFSS